jgi:hypothetical protein
MLEVRLRATPAHASATLWLASCDGARQMRRPRPGLITLAIAAFAISAVARGFASVKVRADFDKAFDFAQARTVAWGSMSGRVIVARTPDDDANAIQQQAEPIITKAVNTEMSGRGLTLTSGTPDLTVTYFLLLTIGDSSHALGQFLPPVTEWAIPPFAPSTTWIKVIHAGSLVLDLSSKGQVVWRGVGESEIKMGLGDEKRAALIRETVQKILKRYPPKK